MQVSGCNFMEHILAVTKTKGLFWDKTDDYGVTPCDTWLLQVSRGVKQAGRAQTSLLLALRLLLHG